MRDSMLDSDRMRSIVAAGLAAPSVHNTQPWHCTVHDGWTLRVNAEPSRWLPVGDPHGRALHVSVGAALFNMRVAAAHLGREPVVRLLPHPGEPSVLADLDLSAPAASRSPYGRDLFPAIAQRHSSRLPYANRDVPEAVAGELMEAARAEGASLVVLEEAGLRRVLALTEEAERRNAADPARTAETRGWVRPESDAPDGVPGYALGLRDTEAHVPMRSFTGGSSAPPGPATHFEALPAMCTLATGTDGPADWLRAGQALERVLLVATVHGLRASLHHQALEWADLRRELSEPEEERGHVQMVLRLGYGPPGPATPRHPVPDVLDIPPEV